MNWLRSSFLIFCLITGFTLESQVPRDTSYTVRSTVKKLSKYYPDLKLEGVMPGHPETIEVEIGVDYKQIGSRRLPANLFLPEGKNVNPVVVLIHGGGWRAGTPELMTSMAERLAEAGFVVMVPEYRLSLEATYPAAKEDLIDAIEWLKNHSENLSIDTMKIAVMGCSAGGQLAALIGTTYPVQAIVDVDGILAFKHPDSQEGTIAAQWLGGTYEEVPQVWEEASALTHVSAQTPPTLFLASKHPRFLAGSQEFMQLLKESGTYTEVQYLEDAPHSFWLLTPWFEQTLNYTIAFLNKTLQTSN